MPSANHISTPIALDEPQIEGRYAPVGEFTVAFETFKQDVDPAPFFVLLASPAPADEPPVVPRAHLWQLPSGLWEIGTEPATAVLPDLRGLAHLRDLVRRPGEQVPVLDLVGSRQPVVEESGLGAVADRQALAAYRTRLLELDEELAEAEDWADTGRVDAARTEREALLHEIAYATGLHGRPRTSGSSQERARIAVRKAITTALDRVTASDPEFAEHLRTSIHTGLACSYEPAPGSRRDWVLD